MIYLEDDSKAKKLLKAAAIMDFVASAIYLAVASVLVYFGAKMIDFKPSEGAEGAEVLGEVIGGFFVILIGMFFVLVGAIALIFFIVYVSSGGTTISLLKKPVDKIARRARGNKVGAILGIIFAIFLVIVAIIAAVGGTPTSLALFLPLIAVTVAASIVNMKMVDEVQLEWKKELERKQEAGEYYI